MSPWAPGDGARTLSLRKNNKNKTEFYKFLNGEKSIEELENFIYSQTDLEQQLDSETYLKLIEMNFKDKYVKAEIQERKNA